MPTRDWVYTDAVGVTAREIDPSIAANVDAAGGLVNALRSSDGSLVFKPENDAGRPVLLSQGFTGKPTLKFYNNGTPNRLKSGAINIGAGWAVFAVVKQTENTGTQSIIDADNYNTGTGNRVAQLLRFDSANLQTIAFTPAVGTAQASTNQGTNLAAKIIGARLVGRTVQISVDGNTPVTATLNADAIAASAIVTLGSWTANNQNFRGEAAIFYLVPTGNLSDADFDRFMGMLAKRFNLQGNFPANHPYKTNGPTVTYGPNPVEMDGLVAGLGLGGVSQIANTVPFRSSIGGLGLMGITYQGRAAIMRGPGGGVGLAGTSYQGRAAVMRGPAGGLGLGGTSRITRAVALRGTVGGLGLGGRGFLPQIPPSVLTGRGAFVPGGGVLFGALPPRSIVVGGGIGFGGAMRFSFPRVMGVAGVIGFGGFLDLSYGWSDMAGREGAADWGDVTDGSDQWQTVPALPDL